MSEYTEVEVSNQEENLAKYKTDQGFYLKWWKEICAVKDSKYQRVFERQGEKITKAYRNADAMDEKKSEDSIAQSMYNVLWSNVQVQKPLLYARMPKVVVERRFSDSDPIGRLACEIAERATSFVLQSQQDRFNYALKSAVEDRLLPGRGQVWIRYKADFEAAKDEMGEVPGLEEGEEIGVEQIVKPNSEMVYIDYVFWGDYFHSLERNPFEQRWRSKRHFMTRSQLVERFGALGKKVQLSSDKRKKRNEADDEILAQAEVWEIEDKEGKLKIWLSDGYKDSVLDVQQDELHLSDFYSSPNPLVATTTTDTVYPTPDFKIYERLAKEADSIAKQISEIVDCVRVVGVHASQYGDTIKSMLDLENGQTAPSDLWMQLAEKGGLKGVIDWFPFERCVEALPPLQARFQELLQLIDLITGIPDFARGITDSQETAEAQQRKAHWIAIKQTEKSADVQRFCREIISKVAEIIFEPGLFADETIALMCGAQQLPPEKQANYGAALSLLRDDRLRTFRVDIETDSTIAIDEAETAGRWMEFMQAMATLSSNVQAVSQFRPEMLSPMLQAALHTVRALRTGRAVEGSLESAIEQIEASIKQAKENPPQTPPDPAIIQAQTLAQTEPMKVQNEQMRIQQDGQKAIGELNIKTQQMNNDFTLGMEKLKLEGAKVFSKAELDKMSHDLNVFKEQFTQEFSKAKESFNQAVSAKELQLLTLKTVSDEHHKAISSVHDRLSLISDHVTKNKEKADGESKEGGSKTNAPAIPAIHIHNSGGSKEVTMKRLPNGDLVGRSTEVSDGTK